MKIKKWYTLLELLMVTILVSLLWVVFSNTFKPKNKDILYWEACVNSIYADISNFINTALTSKSILSGTSRLMPETYYIDINTNNNSISFIYKRQWNNYIYKKLNLTWDIASSYYCYTHSYAVVLSGNDSLIEIRKWINWNNLSLKWFSINSWSSFYEKLNLNLCPYENNIIQYNACKEIWIYEIDTRTDNIKRKNCLNVNFSWHCEERNQ